MQILHCIYLPAKPIIVVTVLKVQPFYTYGGAADERVCSNCHSAFSTYGSYKGTYILFYFSGGKHGF